MKQLQWKMLAGQDRIKEVLAMAFAKEQLGHAYLFCGETGTGTFAAALDLAMALLCRNEATQPCGTCEGCRKVLTFSHPDFHVVMPLSLQKEHKASDGRITEEGWNEFSLRVKERIADPYHIPEYSTLPTIPVDWIREVTHAVRRGTVEKGKNIVILDSVESMQKESANAMLKTLEEPPADTLLILCTERIHAVLPTILSRCQLLRFGTLPPEIVRTELINRYGAADDQRLARVLQSGSIGRAYRSLQQTQSDDDRMAVEFWELLRGGKAAAVFEKIDTISGYGDYGTWESLLIALMQGIRNSFFRMVDASGNYILGEQFPENDTSGTVTPRQADELLQLCETAIGQLRARANSGLVFINFAHKVMEILHGKKQ
jgi:DNA polymerase III delta' subunit